MQEARKLPSLQHLQIYDRQRPAAALQVMLAFSSRADMQQHADRQTTRCLQDFTSSTYAQRLRQGARLRTTQYVQPHSKQPTANAADTIDT